MKFKAVIQESRIHTFSAPSMEEAAKWAEQLRDQSLPVYVNGAMFPTKLVAIYCVDEENKE